MINPMAPKRKQLKKKIITIEDLAAAIQQDFSTLRDDMTIGFRAIREEMATKEDIRKIREEMATKENLADLGDRISVAKDELQEQIAGLRYAKEIDELRARVKFVEHKLGIEQRRRAA